MEYGDSSPSVAFRVTSPSVAFRVTFNGQWIRLGQRDTLSAQRIRRPAVLRKVRFTVEGRGGGIVKEGRIAVGEVYGMAELSHATDQHGGGRLHNLISPM